jgi:hypothetical protein
MKSGPIERGCKRPSLIESRQLFAEFGLQSMCPQYKKMSCCDSPTYKKKKTCVHHFDKWAGGKIGEFTIENVMTSGGKVTYDVYLTKKDRIEFMVKNAHYLKVDEKDKQLCIDNYVAMLLYQDIFAKQID